MNYMKEFPDYDGFLPMIEGFEDTSWHNDACPSLTYKLKADYELRLYVDYDDPERRETGGLKYKLSLVNPQEEWKYIIQTDCERMLKGAIQGFLIGSEQI